MIWGMETNTSSATGIKLGIKSQMKAIEEQIESLAKKLELQGSQSESDELYELGEQVEHFCDKLDSSVAAVSKDMSAPFSR